jgi:hypothetical protein
MRALIYGSHFFPVARGFANANRGLATDFLILMAHASHTPAEPVEVLQQSPSTGSGHMRSGSGHMGTSSGLLQGPDALKEARHGGFDGGKRVVEPTI